MCSFFPDKWSFFIWAWWIRVFFSWVNVWCSFLFGVEMPLIFDGIVNTHTKLHNYGGKDSVFNVFFLFGCILKTLLEPGSLMREKGWSTTSSLKQHLKRTSTMASKCKEWFNSCPRMTHTVRSLPKPQMSYSLILNHAVFMQVYWIWRVQR